MMKNIILIILDFIINEEILPFSPWDSLQYYLYSICFSPRLRKSIYLKLKRQIKMNSYGQIQDYNQSIILFNQGNLGSKHI